MWIFRKNSKSQTAVEGDVLYFQTLDMKYRGRIFGTKLDSEKTSCKDLSTSSTGRISRRNYLNICGCILTDIILKTIPVLGYLFAYVWTVVPILDCNSVV